MENTELKKAYLQGMVYIACSDGKLEDDEKAFFVSKGHDLGMKQIAIDSAIQEVTDGDQFIEEILDKLAISDQKEAFLEDLIKLCFIDGEYSVDEQLGIRNIARYLDIELDTIKRLELACGEMKEENSDSDPDEDAKSGLGQALQFGKDLARITHKVIKKSSRIIFNKVSKGSAAAASSVSKGIGFVGSRLSIAVANAKKLREENQALREELGKTTFTEAVKQKVVLKLNSRVALLNDQLRMEKERNQKNEEMIELLEAQLEDVLATLDAAENAQTA